MRLLGLFVILTVCLVWVVEANGQRTCVRKVEYTVEESHYVFWTKYVKKTRDGLYCCDGYNPAFEQTRHFLEVRSDDECIPFCGRGCPANSYCQPPTTCECRPSSQFYAKHNANQCKCNTGYFPTKEGKCVPFCPDNCMNGICNGLTCTCNKGFIRTKEGKCVPYCSGDCLNGICINSTCVCNEGYIRTEEGKCVPFCPDHCLNGTCQDLTCTCNKGYFRTEEGKCVPFCPDHCLNGTCQNLTCTCNEGFKKNPLQQCVPECMEGCNEDEESLQACDTSGYERDETNECVPKCQHGCTNGNCTSPGNCSCDNGYQLNADTGTCQARCTNCTNGVCMKPEECECNVGFQDVEGICVEVTMAEETMENMEASSTGWLVLGLGAGLAVVVVVVVGYCILKRKRGIDKRNVEAPIAMVPVPRPMLHLPVTDDEEVCEENDLYGRF